MEATIFSINFGIVDSNAEILYYGNMQQSVSDELIKIQPKGVITIPKKFRESLGLSDNDIIRMKKDKGKITIEPVRTLPYPVRSYTDQEIKEFLELDRSESATLKKRKLL